MPIPSASGLLQRFTRAMSRRRELRQLDAREIGAIAGDLNIAPAELITLMRMPDDALEPLNKRLACAGLSEEALARSHADVLRDLRRVCSQCASRARCARDIRHERLANASRYCPNELTLRLLAREAADARSAQAPGFHPRSS